MAQGPSREMPGAGALSMVQQLSTLEMGEAWLDSRTGLMPETVYQDRWALMLLVETHPILPLTLRAIADFVRAQAKYLGGRSQQTMWDRYRVFYWWVDPLRRITRQEPMRRPALLPSRPQPSFSADGSIAYIATAGPQGDRAHPHRSSGPDHPDKESRAGIVWTLHRHLAAVGCKVTEERPEISRVRTELERQLENPAGF